MPAGAARLQPRPSAGQAADRLRPALHARGLAGGRGGVQPTAIRPTRRPSPPQIKKLRQRFARAGGAGRRPWDVTSARIREVEPAGLDWISCLREQPAFRSWRAMTAPLQLSLFDERDLAEIAAARTVFPANG